MQEAARFEYRHQLKRRCLPTKSKLTTVPEFGRIAAQAAKQIIMQKVREAERAFNRTTVCLHRPCW